MTNQEIYEAATLKNLSDPNGTRMDIIFSAMEMLSEQDGIGFALWAGLEGYVLNRPSKLWFKSGQYEFISTKQLWDGYQKYKLSLKK